MFPIIGALVENRPILGSVHIGMIEKGIRIFVFSIFLFIRDNIYFEYNNGFPVI